MQWTLQFETKESESFEPFKRLQRRQLRRGRCVSSGSSGPTYGPPQPAANPIFRRPWSLSAIPWSHQTPPTAYAPAW